MNLRDAIALAQRDMDAGDYQLAAFVLRDLPETAARGLDGLAWAMSQESPSRNDVLYLIEQLRGDDDK